MEPISRNQTASKLASSPNAHIHSNTFLPCDTRTFLKCLELLFYIILPPTPITPLIPSLPHHFTHTSPPPLAARAATLQPSFGPALCPRRQRWVLRGKVRSEGTASVAAASAGECRYCASVTAAVTRLEVFGVRNLLVRAAVSTCTKFSLVKPPYSPQPSILSNQCFCRTFNVLPKETAS